MAHDSPIPRTPVKTYSVRLPQELAEKVEVAATFFYLDVGDWLATVAERELKHYNTGRMDLTNRMRTEHDERWNKGT